MKNKSLQIIESIFQGPAEKIWKIIYDLIIDPYDSTHSGCHYKTALAFRRLLIGYYPNYYVSLIGDNINRVTHSIITDSDSNIVFDSVKVPTSVKDNVKYFTGPNYTGANIVSQRNFVRIYNDLDLKDYKGIV